jgi:hypothetical protein
MSRAVIAMLCAVVLSAHAQEYVQSSASYEEAIRGSFVSMTTSPAYVKIVVVNARTGEEHPTCTTANFLAGAIHRQYGLGYDAEGFKRAEMLAMSAQDHRFVFSDASALQNIPLSFSAQELLEVRERFSALSNDELRDGLRLKPWGKLRDVFPGGRYQDAIACVLIEHGLSPYQADISGQVFVK